MPAPLECTIVITTRNRREELAAAVESALAQTVTRGGAAEVLVMDDASTDGTPELMRTRYPQVRYECAPEARGYIVARNRAARLARAPVIFSLDDDAAYPSARTVEQTLAEFDHPRIGAVAIPYIDVNKRREHVWQRAPDSGRRYVMEAFVGTAHALRRDLFLRLGGYREAHVHQGEESDYCLRMLGAGYVVRVGGADPIHHLESPKRDITRMLRFHARNSILFAWHNIPAPDVLGRLGGMSVNILRLGVKRGYPLAMLKGMLQGYGEVVRGRLERRPVPRGVYRLFRFLQMNAPVPMERIEGELPDMAPC